MGSKFIKIRRNDNARGLTFNGRQLFDDAMADLEKLEEEARLNWEKPVDFFTG